MPHFFYTIDPLYLILVLPAFLFCTIAQIRVSSTFSKYSNVPSARGLNGHDAARAMLDREGLKYVKIEHVRGKLTDHYDPRTETVYLSDAVYNSSSVAAVGVACHEAGHAVQHSEEYAFLKFRSALFPAASFASKWWMLLLIVGLAYAPLAIIGVLVFGITTLFQLITLPVEFNASRRAMRSLRAFAGMSEEQLSSSGKVLRAAAMTYVGALALSIAQLLRLLARFGNSRR